MADNTFERKHLSGRKIIYTNVDAITDDNLSKVMGEALSIHNSNSADIDYLYEYFKGKQPIINRKKNVREDINNKVVVNYANEIVNFKVGYLAGEPIQYISHCEDVDGNMVNLLNDYMHTENKALKDQQIVEWQMICGTAYRYIQAIRPDRYGDCPFKLHTLDPRNTFVVYSNQIGNKPLLACSYAVDDFKNVTNYTIYTDDAIYKGEGSSIALARVEKFTNPFNTIPIYEYPANSARLGAFEVVIDLLDGINQVESDRLDGLDTQIQAYTKFVNCDIDAEGIELMKEYGVIKIKSTPDLPADVDTIAVNFSQTEARTTKEDLLQSVILIAHLPNRSSGDVSTSNTGAGVQLQAGWQDVEYDARSSEVMFKGSENEMLKLLLYICRTPSKPIFNEGTKVNFNLYPQDVELKFTRRNYEQMQSKAQVLCEMLNQPHIHPRLAFEHSGMFSDPETAYTMSEEYYQKSLETWQPTIVDETETDLNDGEV